MKMRKWIIVFMAIILILSLAACTTATTTNATTATTAAKPYTIRINFQQSWEGIQDKRITDAFAATYGKDHPNVSLAWDMNQADGLDSKILAMHAAGGGDESLYAVAINSTSTLQKGGALLDITDRVKNSKIIGADNYFFPGPYANGLVDGKLYAVPMETDARVLVCNMKLLKAANVSPPTTWEEFIAVCKAVTKDGVYGYACAFNNFWTPAFDLGIFFYGDGGNFVKLDSTSGKFVPNFDTPEAVTYLDKMKELIKYMPKDITTYDWAKFNAEFGQGHVAMMFTGPWFYGQIGKDIPTDLEYQFVVTPKGTVKSASTIGGWEFAISSDTKLKDETFSFLEWLCSPEISSKTVGALSAVNDAYNFAPMNDPKYVLFKNQLQTAQPIVPSGCGFGAQLCEAIFPAFQKAILQPSTSAQDAAAINAAIQTVCNDMQK
jgi:ABC-type glycerol-3-phosphate transport system substrate-binding protein